MWISIGRRWYSQSDVADTPNRTSLILSIGGRWCSQSDVANIPNRTSLIHSIGRRWYPKWTSLIHPIGRRWYSQPDVADTLNGRRLYTQSDVILSIDRLWHWLVVRHPVIVAWRSRLNWRTIYSHIHLPVLLYAFWPATNKVNVHYNGDKRICRYLLQPWLILEPRGCNRPDQMITTSNWEICLFLELSANAC